MDGGWHRVSVLLPDVQVNRRYRLRGSPNTGSFAIANMYIGGQCGADGCSGHGHCYRGTCVCDEGFRVSGTQCVASVANPSVLQDDFAAATISAAIWRRVRGGRITADGGGCGPLSDGNSLHFDGSGRRFAITVDVDTTKGTFIEARIRTTSNNSPTCSVGTTTAEGIAVAYSADGGQTWAYLGNHAYYSSAVYFNVLLPAEAQSLTTRFMFWQPSFSGSNFDEWTLDDLFVGYQSKVLPSSLEESFADGITPSLWLHHPWVSLERGYCQSGASEASAVFRDANSQLTTRDLSLSGSYPMVQFE